VTVSFLTLAFAKLWFVLNLRSPNADLLRNEVTGNRWMWGAVALCAMLVVAAVKLPGLSRILETRPIGWGGWGFALGISLIPVFLGQILRLYRKHRQPPSG